MRILALALAGLIVSTSGILACDANSCRRMTRGSLNINDCLRIAQATADRCTGGIRDACVRDANHDLRRCRQACDRCLN